MVRIAENSAVGGEGETDTCGKVVAPGTLRRGFWDMSILYVHSLPQQLQACYTNWLVDKAMGRGGDADKEGLLPSQDPSGNGNFADEALLAAVAHVDAVERTVYLNASRPGEHGDYSEEVATLGGGVQPSTPDGDSALLVT